MITIESHEWPHVVLKLLQDAPLRDHQRTYLEGLKAKTPAQFTDGDQVDVRYMFEQYFRAGLSPHR
jgi:hypothetical protein